ncbi:MAG: ASKHA domain-containing protein [Methylomonas sp.]|nr:ASKHA domain-containing protein [Methylomonas sp.]
MNDDISNPTPEPVSIKVFSDKLSLVLTLPVGSNVRQALDCTELRVRAACGGLGTCGACLIRVVEGRVNPPSLAERQKIPPDDLARGVRLACQLRAETGAELYIDNPAPPSEWKSLTMPEAFRPTHGNLALSDYVYGVAVDLGTTHIRLSLWNRQTARCIASRYSINPQVAHGADVLTRLDAERLDEEDGLRIGLEARKALIEGVRDILSRDMGEVGPILKQVGQVVIVGNTAMLMLVCGDSGESLYRLDNWQRPIECLVDDVDAWRRAWRMPNAEIKIAQPIAGFVGSDLLADLFATQLTEGAFPALLADFGANTEVALWDGKRVWVTSVPGGPAFEGVGMRNGLTAETGAICRVRKLEAGWRLDTLCDTPARGYCASGFIDAVALLLEEGQLKPSGRFAKAQPEGGVFLDPNNWRTAIYGGDIDIFQRAKASFAAAMMQLFGFAGLALEQLDTLWICGSFGHYLDLNNAARVGLLPAIDPARVKLAANASLAGCEKILVEPGADRALAAILNKVKVVNLGGVFEYENRFIEHLRLQPLSALETT